MKKALIVTALAGFAKAFLTPDFVRLREMGYEVHCAANMNHFGSETLKAYFNEQHIIFHQIDFSSNKPFSKSTVDSYKQIRRLLEEHSFSFVHIHTPIPGVLCRIACRKYRRQGTVVAYTTHGFYFHKSSSKKTWMIYYTIEKLMSRYTDAIITINCEDYSNASKMHCKKVFYIPGVGVDIKKYSDVKISRAEYRKKIGLQPDDILILAVGELSERKNHKIVVEALGKIDKKNIVFMVCGDAMTGENTKEQLIQIAKKNGVDLRLMGRRNDIPQVCKCADIGVFPSTREGLGLSGIEMLASGLPVIASGVHGILDYILDGINGYLVNPYDADTFADKIQFLLDAENRKKLSEQSANGIDKFDISNSMNEMNKIYTELLGTSEQSY